MLIIESKKFLLPVLPYTPYFDINDIVAYYNPVFKTLLPGNDYYREHFEELKNGLGRQHLMEILWNGSAFYINPLF